MISIFTAFILDFFIGDPHWLYHPVCAIGWFISKTEKMLRKYFDKNAKGEKIGGFFLFLIVCSVSFLIPCLIFFILIKINFWLYFAVNTFFCTQIFAAGCLKRETMKVYHSLKENDIEAARKKVSCLVGRDTQGLDEEGIIKAAVETIAENTTDGVIAPMIYMLIGGAALGFLYKAVNTLDSMVGYKNEKYINFGKFSAKADDFFNFIPARLTAFFMIIASAILGFNFINAIKIFLRDRNKHTSPNSGQTESVAAGALEVELGGDAYYFSKLCKKARLGDKIREIDKQDIVSANKIMYLSSLLSLLFLIIIRLAAEVLIL